MDPTNNPAKTKGSTTLTTAMGKLLLVLADLVIKAPYNAIATKQADPMANPLPMAAVVLPAASKASVLALVYSPISHISAIPPALSDTGP